MEKEFSSIFSLVYSQMPLSKEELKQIPAGHRTRPYLVFLEHNKFYYGFYCTSKFYDNKERYKNGFVLLDRLIDYKKSLVKLSTVFEIPKRNIIKHYGAIPKKYDNELIKKINSNIEFCDYPNEVVNYFKDMNYKYTKDDIISIDNNYYIIVDKVGHSFVSIPLYKYPVNNTVECTTDGLIYYAGVDSFNFINEKDVEKYHSVINGFSINKKNKKVNIRDLVNHYSSMDRVTNDKDYSKFYNLEPGMIIEFPNGESKDRMIILTNDSDELEVLSGSYNEMYNAFVYNRIPADIDLKYEIFGTLTSERLEAIKSKHIDELKNNKSLILK